ncbi:MAG: hypothetical protein P4L66_15915 [Acetobacteraceae bacterium]|nr:hypothetical protein [Acetobacteraceae bacterium]
MIDLDDRDILLTRRDSGGRFVIFTTTDVQPSWPVPWWVAVLDTGGDGIGVPVRIDHTAAPDGWTALQLIEVAMARAEAEVAAAGARDVRDMRGMRAVAALMIHLAAALRAARQSPVSPASADPVTFEAGSESSRFGWTVARCGEHTLPFCHDASGKGEGVTLEQVLIVLNQLFDDGVIGRSLEAWLWRAKRHVALALAALSGSPGKSD